MNTEMKVSALTVDPSTSQPVLVLKDLTEHSTISIGIGLVEATAIVTELEHIRFPRPMPHELLCNVVTALGARLEAVEVRELNNDAFGACLKLLRGGERLEIEARASDAVALALRTGCPILVDVDVLARCQEGAGTEQALEEMEAQMEEALWVDLLERLPKKDFGKYMM